MNFSSLISKPKNISQKMLAAIFVASSIVTFAITSIQLSFDYFQEISAVKKNMLLIEKSYTQSVAESVWELRVPQLKLQLEGIISIPGIQNVQVIDQGRVIASAGDFKESKNITSTFNLVHSNKDSGTSNIGSLVVRANLEEVFDKILNRVLIIFITQFIKTLLVSFFIYLCIQQIITKHLVHISNHLKNFTLNKTDDFLQLERPEVHTPDELDTLVLSINEMRNKIDQSYLILNHLNTELEEKVKTKTEIVLDQRIKLEHAAKMTILGEMAGGIAHEINNPITVISATSRIIKRNFEKGITDPSAYEKYFDEIDKTIIRINKIITGLRVVSRDGANEGFQEEKILDIFNDVIGLCGEKFKNHNVELKVNLEDEVFQTIIKCGRIQLSQVFLNLLGNSYDAIEEQTDKWISIQGAVINDKLELRFTDSGNGIPLEIQEKILTPFFTTKVLGKGTGLGLSISNSIIKSHRGEFTIDNNCKNTCFVLTFPIHKIVSDKISA